MEGEIFGADMAEQKENKLSVSDDQIGREVADCLFSAKLSMPLRYAAAGALARSLVNADGQSLPITSDDLAELILWKGRAEAAEQSLESLRSYLETRLRNLEGGGFVTGHYESCGEIMDRVGFELVPAHPLKLTKV